MAEEKQNQQQPDAGSTAGGVNDARAGLPAEPSFAGLIMTLALSALQFLSPGNGDKRPDYRQAKPMIDTLEVLKEKTKGNLTRDESELLDSLLLDLRVRYLKAGASQPEPATPAKP
jgi:hypothetical protein